MAKEGPGRGGDTGVMDTLAVDELVSMEWSDVQDDDSESCNEREKSGYTQLHTVTHSYTRRTTTSDTVSVYLFF